MKESATFKEESVLALWPKENTRETTNRPVYLLEKERILSTSHVPGAARARWAPLVPLPASRRIRPLGDAAFILEKVIRHDELVGKGHFIMFIPFLTFVF